MICKYCKKEQEMNLPFYEVIIPTQKGIEKHTVVNVCYECIDVLINAEDIVNEKRSC